MKRASSATGVNGMPLPACPAVGVATWSGLPDNLAVGRVGPSSAANPPPLCTSVGSRRTADARYTLSIIRTGRLVRADMISSWQARFAGYGERDNATNEGASPVTEISHCRGDVGEPSTRPTRGQTSHAFRQTFSSAAPAPRPRVGQQHHDGA